MTCQEDQLVVDFDPDRPVPVVARDPVVAGPAAGAAMAAARSCPVVAASEWRRCAGCLPAPKNP
jgi:hypothetical protein